MGIKNFQGRWKITRMDRWKLEPGWFVEFDSKGNGRFHFLCVDLELDCRMSDSKNSNRADFSFYGHDEFDEVYGRGWVEMDGKNIEGYFCFHQGDDSGFSAELVTLQKRSLKKVSIQGKRKKI